MAHEVHCYPSHLYSSGHSGREIKNEQRTIMDRTLEKFFGEMEPGFSVDGFTIEKKVGEGAMANLYLVRDANGQQHVIKVPRQSFNIDPVSLVAFENELRLAPHLEDFPYAYLPRINGQASGQYLVMDYIRGVDLWSHLKAHGPLPESEVVVLGQKIVRAVAELHRCRIVHLDLKLSNVMHTPEGDVRLIDFGLANHLDLPDLIYESFREPKGTPAYIAPEQFIGVRDEPRSDLFSVGIMLFELATGKLPYPDGSSVHDVINRIKRKPVSPRFFCPALSLHFEYIIGMCLHADPDARFSDMDALHTALQSWQPDPVTQIQVEPATPNGLVQQFLLLPDSISTYFRRLFNRADHFGQITRWAEQRRLNRETRLHRILAAIDLTAGEALNLEILRHARQMASLQPSLITVMSVLSVEVGMASGDKEAEIVNEQLIKTRRQITALLEKTGQLKTSVGVNVVIGTDPVSAIAQCVEDYGVDLVVIGCKPKQLFANFIDGKIGYKILTMVKRSVFVVHAPPATSVGPRALAANQAA
jgi:serine/threonine protein kinase